ncbi:MAG TPA: molybdopterin dinucleotide binding domain-containing protein, partial [Rhodanobacteraceae bacterium]|nr:molybdopterin dinucleotide binding domain-containing protein [Rhodanobacteraceae bacterium]
DGFGFTEIAEVRAEIAADHGIAQSAPKRGIASVETASGRGLERIATTAIYRADAVLRRTPSLQSHPLTRGACATLNPEDALAHGLGHGANARIGDATLRIEISRRVPKGAVWIEAGYAQSATLPPYGATLEITKA